MKKKNIKYSKTNVVTFFKQMFKNGYNYMLYNKKRLATSLGMLSATAALAAGAAGTGCTPEEVEAVNNYINNNYVNEQVIDQPPVDEKEVNIDQEQEVKDDQEVKEESTPIETVEEINLRDMKAVYGLDYDVPIYTEEEIEQAKSNLTSNYDDNIVKSVDTVAERGYTYTDEQLKEMAPDYYAANQDLWYQLNDMVKDYHGAPAGTYYDEVNDLYVTVDSKGNMDIAGKDFRFKKDNDKDLIAPIGEIAYSDLIQVGPGTYVMLGSDVTRQWAYEGSAGMYENYDGRSFETLENAGYNPQKIEHDCVNIEDEAYSLELK